MKLGAILGAQELGEIFADNISILEDFKSGTLAVAEAVSKMTTALEKMLGINLSDSFLKDTDT
jgi:hypothetical protein